MEDYLLSSLIHKSVVTTRRIPVIGGGTGGIYCGQGYAHLDIEEPGDGRDLLGQGIKKNKIASVRYMV